MFDKLSKLGAGSLESAFWRVLGTACLFFMHIFLGRKLSPEDYGLFSFTLSIVGIAVLLTTMGWPRAIVRLIPQYNVAKQWGLFKGLLLTSNISSLVLSGIASVVLVVISMYIDDEHRSSAIKYAALFLPLRSLIMLRRSMFQALHNVRGSVLPDEVLLPGLMLVCLLLAETVSIYQAIQYYFFLLIIVFLIALIWLWAVLPTGLKSAKPGYQLEEWTKITAPLLLGGLAQVVLGQSGVFVLGFYGEMQGAGLFGAAYRVALFVTFIMTAVNVIGVSLMASAFHDNNMTELIHLRNKSRLWSVFGAIPFFALFFLFPIPVLGLFGSEFEAAKNLLQILAVGQLVNASVGLSGSILVVGGGEKYFMNSMILTSIFCITMMIIIIPVLGAEGAAYVYSVSISVLSIIQLVIADKLILKKSYGV